MTAGSTASRRVLVTPPASRRASQMTGDEEPASCPYETEGLKGQFLECRPGVAAVGASEYGFGEKPPGILGVGEGYISKV